MIDAGTALAEIRYGLGAILPEVYLLSLLVVLILLDVRGASRRQAAWLWIGAQLGLLGWLLYQGPPAQPRPALLGQVVQDATGWYLRLVLTASQLLTLFLTLRWPGQVAFASGLLSLACWCAYSWGCRSWSSASTSLACSLAWSWPACVAMCW